MRRLKRFKNTTAAAGPDDAGAELRAVAGEELWWPPGGSAGVVVTEQTALQNTALLAVANTLGTDVAAMPLCVRQRMEDGSKREATEHPNHELVARSPDGEATPIRWRQSWMLHALIYGNGYAEIQRLGDGRPYALHLLDPSSTKAERGPDRRLYYRTGVAAAGSRPIPAENVLHLAGIGFDGVSGYNMVRLLRQSIGLGIAGETFAADFFSNGSEAGGVIEIPGRLENDDAVQRLRNRWEGRHQGAGRRHRVAILEEGAKFSATSTDPEKSQLLETRKYQVLDTIRAWRVPPHKAGDFSESHLANIEASNLDYLMSALMGWLVAIEQEWNLKMFSRREWRDGYHVEHDTRALLRADVRTRFDSFAAAIRDGWMSRNEVRAREGLNPIPADQGGDLYTVQMQVVPLNPSPEAEPDADDSPPTDPPADTATEADGA